jgi:hypothetical protein
LAPDQFLNHNHPIPELRVPHVTHNQVLEINPNKDRLAKAVAIVSNHGGSPWRRHPGISYRNRFITQPGVDLFGRSGWNRYRTGRFSLARGAPSNYRGELPGDWPAAGKRELMARYKVAVCFENMNEPYYFTEKFVEAVCAGCIPVYRADPTVASGVLRGALWIDPANHGDDPERTIQAALRADVREFQETNGRWLKSRALAETHHLEVFRRIGAIIL